jgi:hypothetical protein
MSRDGELIELGVEFGYDPIERPSSYFSKSATAGPCLIA